MTKFYATADGQPNGYIEENAEIEVFDSMDAAVNYLNPDKRPAKILEGNFSDCWIKCRRKPRVGDHLIAPFTYTDLIIQRPGTHPGGKEYWITPSRPVLVAEFLDIED